MISFSRFLFAGDYKFSIIFSRALAAKPDIFTLTFKGTTGRAVSRRAAQLHDTFFLYLKKSIFIEYCVLNLTLRPQLIFNIIKFACWQISASSNFTINVDWRFNSVTYNYFQRFTGVRFNVIFLEIDIVGIAVHHATNIYAILSLANKCIRTQMLKEKTDYFLTFPRCVGSGKLKWTVKGHLTFKLISGTLSFFSCNLST